MKQTLMSASAVHYLGKATRQAGRQRTGSQADRQSGRQTKTNSE